MTKPLPVRIEESTGRVIATEDIKGGELYSVTSEIMAALRAAPVCINCGTGSEITYAPNPYAYDVNGDDTPVWMCASCRDESA